MKIELYYCPFCGSRPVLTKGFKGVHFILCAGCGAVVSFRGNEKAFSAANMYNRRVKKSKKM